MAPAAEHIDSACDAPAPAQTEGNWLEMVEQAWRVPCASRPGSASTQSPLNCYTVIVIITKRQQKGRQLLSWRAWRWLYCRWRQGKEFGRRAGLVVKRET